MKRGIIALILITLLSSIVSADIIFNSQFNPVYNLGGNIFVPVTVKSIRDVSGIFQMDLICNNGSLINFYKNGVKLNSGDEKAMDSSLVLIKGLIGSNVGICKIKASLGTEYTLSDEFKISDSLIIEANLEETEFNAGESIYIKGKAKKETGENANGFIEARIITGDINQEIKADGTITGGSFSINLTLPSDLGAGTYAIELNVYEKDSDGFVSNKGLNNYNIYVKQVPTNLELIFENKEINPGEPLKIKAILHDQTGESIDSSAFITIKSSSDKILDQRETATNEFIEYISKSNMAPQNLKIFATSTKLSTEDFVYIKEKEFVNVEIINKTILVTNTGNVYYNKTLLVKVGVDPLNLEISLDVGESRKYKLSAPDGEYNVKIITEGENEISGVMKLTGNAVDIRETGKVSLTIFFWIILIIALIVGAYFAYRKVHKKAFIGKINFNIFKKKDSALPIIRENKIIKENNRAEMSSSIKGEKQEASIVCIKIKGLKAIKSNKGSASDTLDKIVDIAVGRKAAVYENQDYLYIMLAPVKTKELKNEKTALELSEIIHKELEYHNKTFNQKISFGISIDYGAIVAKLENGILKFMAMDSLMINAKKIASLSNGEILIGNKMNDIIRLAVRTEKQVRDHISVYVIKEIKKENEETRKFIERFSKNYGKK